MIMNFYFILFVFFGLNIHIYVKLSGILGLVESKV